MAEPARRRAPPASRGGRRCGGRTITLEDITVAPDHDTSACIEQAFVDVIVRAHEERDAVLLQRKLRDLIAPIGAPGGRKMWQMAGLLVERSTLWRGDQPVGQDKKTYDRSQAFLFECRRKALAGQPYAP